MSDPTSFQLRPISAGIVFGYPTEGLRVDALVPSLPQLGVHAFGGLAADGTAWVHENYTFLGSRTGFDFGGGVTLRPLAGAFNITPTLSLEARGRFVHSTVSAEPTNDLSASAGLVAGIEGRHVLSYDPGSTRPAIYWSAGVGFHAS